MSYMLRISSASADDGVTAIEKAKTGKSFAKACAADSGHLNPISEQGPVNKQAEWEREIE